MRIAINVEVWLEINTVGAWVRSDVWAIGPRHYATIDGERVVVVAISGTWVVA